MGRLIGIWGGLLQYQMDMSVRLILPKAGAFGETTVSKNEGSLGEKPNLGSKLVGIGWECYFWSFSERFKSRNLQQQKKRRKWQKWSILSMKLKQKVASCSSRMQQIGRLWVRAETIIKYMGSLGDSTAENRGSLEPYIHVTSITW